MRSLPVAVGWPGAAAVLALAAAAVLATGLTPRWRQQVEALQQRLPTPVPTSISMAGVEPALVLPDAGDPAER
ncbi:MAG: hypothetical protein WC760_15015, partial [Bacteroidia bacterium]